MEVKAYTDNCTISTANVVYCVYDEGILAEHPYALGRESFLLDPHGTLEDSWEWFYEDLGKTWFFDLSGAQRRLLEDFSEMYPDQKVEIVRVNENYWELREVEEYE